MRPELVVSSILGVITLPVHLSNYLISNIFGLYPSVKMEDRALHSEDTSENSSFPICPLQAGRVW